MLKKLSAVCLQYLRSRDFRNVPRGTIELQDPLNFYLSKTRRSHEIIAWAGTFEPRDSSLFHVEQNSHDHLILQIFLQPGTSDQNKPALGLWYLNCRRPDPARRGGNLRGILSAKP
jgi:hypothetical protein